MKNYAYVPNATIKTPRGVVESEHRSSNGRGSSSDPGHCSCVTKLASRARSIREALQHAYSCSLRPLPSFNGKAREDLDVAKARLAKWCELQVGARCGGGRRERHGLRMSIALMKRGFPDPCERCSHSGWKSFRAQQMSPVRPVGPEFLDFVKKEVGKLFPRGWLSKKWYERLVQRSCVSSGASSISSRSKGGMRYDLSHSEYLAMVENPEPSPLGTFKYADVISAGKSRGVTLQPPAMAPLRPLHAAIYSKIRREKWLLTGPPTSKAFRRAGFQFRESLLSGDYKSATNNLSLEVARAILSAILDGATGVPEQQRLNAMQSLDVRVRFGSDEFRVMRGTMMGSYLSFPILCLYNRLATLYALGECPMLVNGDDLVAETADPSPWHELLPSLGLEPESRKTTYFPTSCNINSTAIVVQRKQAVICKTMRMRALVPKLDIGIDTLGERFRAFTSECPRRLPGANAWLTHHGPLVHSLIEKGVSLGKLGFQLEDLQYLPALVGHALYRARRLFAETNPPTSTVELSHTGETVLVPERNLNQSLRSALTIDRFYYGPPLLPGSYKTASKTWAELRKCTPNKRSCSWVPAQKIRRMATRLPSKVSRAKWYFNHYCDSSTFLARICGRPRSEATPVPAWAWALESPSSRRCVLYPFRGVAGTEVIGITCRPTKLVPSNGGQEF